jgi:DNA-binding transcriptional LysR family regulator
MGRLCAEFRRLYPDVTVEVVAENRVVDLVDERFDLAIRPNPRMDSTLVGRRFATDRLVIVAAPDIAMPPSGPTPVSVPAVVTTGREGDQWVLDGASLTLLPQPVLRLSSLLMARDAVIAGAGVGLLPQSIVWNQLTRGELVQWGAVPGKEVALWVLHTSRRLASPKVKAFVEFLAARYPDGTLTLAG